MAPRRVAAVNALSPAFTIPDPDPADDLGHLLVCRLQRQSNWCWAACVQMLLGDAKPMEQWEIANVALDRLDCELHGGSPECNRTLKPSQGIPNLTDILRRLTGGARLHADSIPGVFLRDVLAVSPIVVGFAGGKSDGHVVLVSGLKNHTDPDNPLLWVSDPLVGHSAWKSRDEVAGGLSYSSVWTTTISHIGVT
jgi:hypothetical protein